MPATSEVSSPITDADWSRLIRDISNLIKRIREMAEAHQTSATAGLPSPPLFPAPITRSY